MTENAKTPAKAPKTGQVQQASPFSRFVEMIRGEAELTETFDNGSEIMADVINRVLSAETLEDAFAAQDAGLQNGKDYVDVELTVNEFSVRTSDSKYRKDGDLGVYVRVDAVRLDTGETVQFFTGAPNVVVMLWQARKLDKLPLDCVVKSKETANGELLTLKPLAKRVVR